MRLAQVKKVGYCVRGGLFLITETDRLPFLFDKQPHKLTNENIGMAAAPAAISPTNERR